MRTAPVVRIGQFRVLGIRVFFILSFEFFKLKKSEERQYKVKRQMDVKYSSVVCSRMKGRTAHQVRPAWDQGWSFL